MEEKQIGDELASIRSLMERSSKFISLSGLSGILAGVYALIGAAFSYNILYNGIGQRAHNPHYRIAEDLEVGSSLVFIALVVLAASVITGFVLSLRKAKKKGQSVWGKTSQLLFFHMATPLITGGLLILIFINRGYYDIVAPSTLVFYGLALVSASSFTFTDVKYLGLCEIILGLAAACIPGFGLLFWAIGFGVLHIVYGSIMYLKYDK